MWRAINHVLAAGFGVALLVASPVAARNKSHAPAPKGSPARWFTNDDYPADARRANQQGRVAVEVTVGVNGLVSECRVVTSSGSAALDQATCDLIRRRGRFDPALDRRGRAIVGTYALSTRWQLQADGPVMLSAPRRAAGIIGINQVGKAVSCRAEASGNEGLPPFPCDQIDKMSPAFGLFARSNDPSPGPVDVTFESAWSLDGGVQPAMTYDRPDRKIVSLLVLHFEVGLDGAVQNCKVIVSVGRPSTPDPCEKIPPRFDPQKAVQGVTIKDAVSRPADGQ